MALRISLELCCYRGGWVLFGLEMIGRVEMWKVVVYY